LAEHLKRAQRDVPLRAFDCTYVGAMKAAEVGQFFLGNAQLGSKDSNVRRESLSNLGSGLSKCSLVLHQQAVLKGFAPENRLFDAYASTDYE
jgi:hypothetical protein